MKRAVSLILAIGLVLGGQAASLRFYSSNSAVASGIWLTDAQPSSAYNLDNNPRVRTSFRQGYETPVVCVSFRSDSYVQNSSNAPKLKFEFIANGNTFVDTLSVDYCLYGGLYGDGYIYGWGAASLPPAVNLSPGTYKVRVTVSCDGYASATAETTVSVTSSTLSLSEALGCESAVKSGLVSLSTSSSRPWIPYTLVLSGQAAIASGTLGLGEESVLTMTANAPIYFEVDCDKLFASYFGETSCHDVYSWYGYDRFTNEVLLDGALSRQRYAAFGMEGRSFSWVYQRDNAQMHLIQQRCGLLGNMEIIPLVQVSFDPNGGEAVDSIWCVPGKNYDYMYEKFGVFPFPEDGPIHTKDNMKFIGWYNSGGEKITGSSIVPKSASSHTLKARWEKEKDDMPDLVVSVAYADKITIYESESTRVHWRISNIGEGVAMETRTSYAYGRKKRSAYCPSLAKGCYSDSARTFYGSVLGVGTHTITITADCDGGVDEESEDNNMASVTITVIPDSPPPYTELNWQYHKISPSEPGTLYLSASEQSQSSTNVFKVGQRIYLQVNFWNAAGNQSLEPVRVRFELDDERYGELRWPENGEHGSRGSSTNGYWISDEYRCPSWLQNLPKGEYILTAILDSEKRWSEQSESDNVQEIEFVVEGVSGSDGGHDGGAVDLAFYVPKHYGWTDSLIVSSDPFATVSQKVFEPGEPICLNYAFNNAGNGLSVSNFVNRFTLSNGYYWEHSWIGYSVLENGWGWLGYNFMPGFLNGLPPGDYTLTCVLNADKSLPESNMANNTASVSFKVKGPDLVVSSLSASRTSIALSESATVHWRTQNNGDAAAQKTQTAFQILKYDEATDFYNVTKTVWLDCNPLAAGAGRESTYTITGKSLGVGEYIIRVWADGKDVEYEKNETDNYAIAYITVTTDNAAKSSSGVDWQFHEMKGEPDSFYLSTSANAKKKATTFKVGQPIYMRCCWWNATKNAAYGDMRVRVLLNGRAGIYADRSSFNKNSWYYFIERMPDFLQNLPAGKYTLTAVLDSENNFVEKNEKNNIRRISFTVVDAPTIYGEAAYTCALNESVSWPISSEGSVSVKGLPPGMKYSGGAIVGKATKTGTFTAKFTAKNAFGTQTKTVEITVVNPGFNVDVTVRANGATEKMSVASGGTIPMYAGVKQNIEIVSEPGKPGVAKSAASSVTAAGLPPGLKYAKGVISGVPTKGGTFTVKLTFKNALGWSRAFTMKMAVKPLPAFARGTFNGWSYSYDEGTEGGFVEVRKATISVTSAGKMSATIGSLKFTGTGWTVGPKCH